MVNKFTTFLGAFFFCIMLSSPMPILASTQITNIVATSSNTKSSSDPSHALDSNTSTNWESGQSAPQWILLDLGQPTTINQIWLTPSQSPSGRTTHVIIGGSSPSSLHPLITIDQITHNNQSSADKA